VRAGVVRAGVVWAGVMLAVRAGTALAVTGLALAGCASSEGGDASTAISSASAARTGETSLAATTTTRGQTTTSSALSATSATDFASAASSGEGTQATVDSVPSSVDTAMISTSATTTRSIATTTTVVAAATTATTPVTAESAARMVPVRGKASWGREHHDYPATDIFAPCGADVISPVDGVVIELRRDDLYDATTDNPAHRGGRSFTIVGVDGVRYYGSHLASVSTSLRVNDFIAAGTAIGTVGDSGRASGCHLHFGLSSPCPGIEWKVRRGVVWPWRFLDAWAAGNNLNPSEDIAQWLTENPGACDEAQRDSNAGDA
jgi:peptidoglycan LD-endopeptidase LytH